jgi:DNA-binding response OmpR family regulator
LLVDDKEANRDLLSRRLYKEGFRVELAENGRQALQMLRNMDFDLVLLDIIMPEMDGYQVLGEIKRDEQLCRMPVIMISALDEIDSVVRCIEMGAEDYLQKPFNQVILNAKISSVLKRKRLRDRERAFLEILQTEKDHVSLLTEEYHPSLLTVVDGNEINRELLKRRLNKQGFEVEVAENGKQALQMIRKKEFDLILLDISMPEMDGYQVLKILKKDKDLMRIPVIILSALDEIDSVVRCIEMGAEDYLQKPFNQMILNAKISSVLEHKRLRDRERVYLEKLQTLRASQRSMG